MTSHKVVFLTGGEEPQAVSEAGLVNIWSSGKYREAGMRLGPSGPSCIAMLLGSVHDLYDRCGMSLLGSEIYAHDVYFPDLFLSHKVRCYNFYNIHD